MAVGAVAVNVGVSLVILNALILTYIGAAPDGSDGGEVTAGTSVQAALHDG